MLRSFMISPRIRALRSNRPRCGDNCVAAKVRGHVSRETLARAPNPATIPKPGDIKKGREMKKGRSLGPAEVDHRKSLSLLRATLESTADGVLVVDNLGKISTYNQQFAEMWRLPPQVLSSGKDEDALNFVRDELKDPDRFRDKGISRDTVETGVGRRTEFRFVLKDGGIRYIESEGRVIRDAAGKVSKVVVVSRDISERKRAEQREKMEHAVTRVLAESETLAEAIPKVLQTICETLNWDCGARWSMDERKKAIACSETWSIP